MTRHQILNRLLKGRPVTVVNTGNYIIVNPGYQAGMSDDRFAFIASRNSEDIDAIIETFPTANIALNYALENWKIENIVAAT